MIELLLRLPVALVIAWAGWNKLVNQAQTPRPLLGSASRKQNQIAWIAVGVADCLLALWIVSGVQAVTCALALAAFLVLGGVNGLREIEAHGSCGCGGFEARTPRRLIVRNGLLGLVGIAGLVPASPVEESDLPAAAVFLIAVTMLTLLRGPIATLNHKVRHAGG